MTGPLLMLLSFAAQDTLTLTRAHQAAASRDPRMAQIALAATASDARIAAIELERKPSFTIRSEATHQSDVTGIPGGAIKQPPLDRFQATLNVEQLLYDAGNRQAREELEHARLGENTATLAVTRFGLTSEVDRQFFAALSAQHQAEVFDASIADLAGRLVAARARVREGSGLPRDTAMIEAERLTAVQRKANALVDRATSLRLLAQLTGLSLDAGAPLAIPDVASRVAQITSDVVLDSMRHRPEFVLLQRTQIRLDAERALTAAVNAPRVVAFGQGGVGRPGLNQFETSLSGFWIAGVKLEWRPFTWHSAELNSEALEAQRRAISADAAALSEQLARAAIADLAHIAVLKESLDTDSRISVLRAQVDATAKIQFDEGTITASEYLTSRTALLEARLAEERDRTELIRVQATLLTTLGIPL